MTEGQDDAQTLRSRQGPTMSEVDFDQHSELSVHFFSQRVPGLLSNVLTSLAHGSTLVDVGCGDGHLVWALASTGSLPVDATVIGVDLSAVRRLRFTALTGHSAIAPHGHEIPDIGTATVDLAISTMVIEHVPDDLGHAKELARITRPGGLLYLSTVIRKRGAWYFRKAPDGRRVLDPTHLREYASPDEVIRLVEAGGFVIRQVRLTRLFFPIAHPIVRWWNARRRIEGVQRIFLRPSMAWLESIALPIPRYRSIEVVAERLTTNDSTPQANG